MLNDTRTNKENTCARLVLYIFQKSSEVIYLRGTALGIYLGFR